MIFFKFVYVSFRMGQFFFFRVVKFFVNVDEDVGICFFSEDVVCFYIDGVYFYCNINIILYKYCLMCIKFRLILVDELYVYSKFFSISFRMI